MTHWYTTLDFVLLFSELFFSSQKAVVTVSFTLIAARGAGSQIYLESPFWGPLDPFLKTLLHSFSTESFGDQVTQQLSRGFFF